MTFSSSSGGTGGVCSPPLPCFALCWLGGASQNFQIELKKSNISLHKTRTFSPCAQSEIKPASFPLGRGVGALLAQTLTLQKLFKTSVNQTAQRTAREKKINFSCAILFFIFFPFSNYPPFFPGFSSHKGQIFAVFIAQDLDGEMLRVC